MNLPPFQNEPYTDFSQPANRQAMQRALELVRSQFGKEYKLNIAGSEVATYHKLISVNPSHPDEVVGIHHKATPALAINAIDSASRRSAILPGASAMPFAERPRRAPCGLRATAK